MKKFPLVFDLETKYTFREYDDPRKLGVTVLSAYDYGAQKSMVFTEKELPAFFPMLEKASYIIGYNIDSFDMAVLEPYYPGDIKKLPTFDILEDIKNIIGKRLALNDLVSTTLNKKKSGHGLMAITYYQEGRWDELKKYCLDDTMLTKELFEFGYRHKEIYYLTSRGKATIRVSWEKYMDGSGNNDTHLTLPF